MRCPEIFKKSLAEFAAKAAKKIKIILCRGVYLTQNSYQAASVDFVFYIENKICAQQTAKTCRKAPKGIFDRLKHPIHMDGVPVCHNTLLRSRTVFPYFRDSRMASAVRMPSMAADMMPPA